MNNLNRYINISGSIIAIIFINILIYHINIYTKEIYDLNSYEKSLCNLRKVINVPTIVEKNISNIIFYENNIKVFGLFNSNLSSQIIVIPLQNNNEYIINKTRIECFYSKENKKELILSFEKRDKELKLKYDFYNIFIIFLLFFLVASIFYIINID